jgi:23S rRNA pseudouridine1911/1915/1917 synthase
MISFFKQTVAANDPHQLGHFLLKHGFSRRALKAARYHGGWILVNHRRRLLSFHLRTGDEVIFIPGQEKPNPYLRPVKGPVEIVAETANYLLVNKPAGLLTIPSRYEDQHSIVNYLLAYFQAQGLDTRTHVVTRLDRCTSGLVLVGKNSIAQSRFSQESPNQLQKNYHAIVHGNFKEQTGKVELRIGQVGQTVKRAIDPQGQRAITLYRVLRQVPGASYLSLQLLTGRTHQIRVHMQAIGHPLFGDQLYGVPDCFARQALNAYQLRFFDPFAQEEQLKTIEDPADMQQLWQQLKHD